MGRITRRMETIERRMEGMERRMEALEAALVANPPQPPPQEEVQWAQCTTVDELVELDRSLAQPDRKNQMVKNWS